MKPRWLLLACATFAASTIGGVVALTRSDAATPTPPFLPPAVRGLEAPHLLTPASKTPRALSASSRATRHFEYVFPDGEMDVYDIDHGFRLVERVSIPEAHPIRGVAVSPLNNALFITVGGRGGATGTGSLLRLDLRTNRIAWERAFPTGVDSPSITLDGRMLYLPTGENSTGDSWYVVQARNGRVVGEIHGGLSPHNTIVGPSGRKVYLGPRNGTYLVVADTKTNRIVQRIGPLRSGVRPFTIDGHERFAFTTATGFLGFQVSSIATGAVLDTVPIPHFSYDPATFAPTAPSHGIALSPDSRLLWVIDAPNSYVHEFDVSNVPTGPPVWLADVRLASPMTGDETPCGQDCARDGWLQESADGRFLFVGDSGDVVDTRTRSVVAFLPALRNSRYQLELDWRRGKPIATTTRSSIGRP
jgi:DNA-binding beta-propeller fold protein YncE